MKKSLILISVLACAVSLVAQVRTGTIWGHVTDTQGAPLPGVSVSLKSTYSAILTQVTDAQGIYRFPSLEPSKEYTLRAELQGFKKQEKTGIIVVIGQQSRIDFTMEQGKLEEEVTVVAVTPTVDAKKTMVGKNVTQEILQALPTSRDPWNVMQLAPGIIMDRENVGGSESGQQAGYYAKGDPTGGSNNVWALDGVVVTDNAAIGGSPIYWDFDSFEEMNIVTGGADVSIQTGGIALNMVTRRGGNKVSMGGRFYLTDGYFQATPSASKLLGYGLTPTSYNRINTIKDYGFNVGGPIVKDRVWLWGSYGVQDINAVTIIGTPQKPVLTDYNFKLNIQPIPSNRFEAFLVSGNKTFYGRDSSQSFPEGNNQSAPYHFGDPTIKIQDEQTIGNNLLVSAKCAYSIAAFQLIPTSDPNSVNLVRYDATASVQHGGGFYITKRPNDSFDFHIQYFNDKILGVSHEIKLGVEYAYRRVNTDAGNPGDLTLYYDLNYPDLWWAIAPGSSSGNPGFTPGMTQFGLWNRYNGTYTGKQLTAFLQDTITAGRFNFLLGLRYDRQTPGIVGTNYETVNDNPVWNMFDADVKQALYNFMPGTIVPTINPNYHWNLWSPRLGVTYDLFGTGKTILKLSGSLYGDYMGAGWPGYLYTPYGAGGSWMYFWWYDANHDGRVQASELYGNDPTTFAPIPLIVNGAVNPVFINTTEWNQWGSFTPGSTAPQPSPYTVNGKATSTYTWEVLATIEHELLPDFNVGLTGSYRKYDHYSWDVPYYINGPLGDYSVNGQSVLLSPSSYYPAATIPSTITYTDSTGTHTVDLGSGPGHTYYFLQSPYQGTPYYYHTLNTNYNSYWGLDLTFNKRLSHKWMLDGSVSYMDQRQHYGNGYLDPSSLWAIQDTVTAPGLGGGSGKINQYVFSHWMVKLEGLYQLPYGFDISFTFNARAGHIIPHYITIVDYRYTDINPTNYGGTYYLDVFGNQRLPNFYQLNLRLEKMIKLFDTGRIYLMADAFNVTNAAIINRRYDRYEGTYYIHSDGSTSFVPYAFNYTVNEILNPFIARFGIRFQF
jgi:hypothetical protein